MAHQQLLHSDPPEYEPEYADEVDLPVDQWRCTYEHLVHGSPATITDCDELALPDTEPPRCWLHEGKP